MRTRGGGGVAKFYRPARWSDARSRVHGSRPSSRRPIFRRRPAVFDGRLSTSARDFLCGFRAAVARAPELDDAKTRGLGRFIGPSTWWEARPFAHRPALDIESFGTIRADYFPSRSRFIPADLLAPGSRPSIARSKACGCVARAGDFAFCACMRCHPSNGCTPDSGNAPGGPHFVDLDDSRMAPAVQDLWMLISGDRHAMGQQLGRLLKGYEDFAEFDDRELHLVEALRTLRLIHYSAWLARRWDAPAFPCFSLFRHPRAWQTGS